MKKVNNDEFTSEYLFDEDKEFINTKKKYSKQVDLFKTSEYLFSEDEEFAKKNDINNSIIQKYSIEDLKKHKYNKKECFYYKRYLLVSLCILILVFVSFFMFGNRYNEQERLISYCNNVYKVMKIKGAYDESEVNKCLSNLDIISDSKEKDIIFKRTNALMKYLNFKDYISSYYADGKINTLLDDGVINKMNNSFDELDSEYKEELELVMLDIKEQNEQAKNMVEKVEALFTNSNKEKVKENITYSEYNEAVSLVNNVSCNEIKNEYVSYLEKVHSELDDRREKEIERAWIKLNVPYISQNLSKVYNGCELASLLMALKYKGYLNDVDLITYANGINISDSPYTGFYLSIFNYEPRDLTHWIHPTALIEYAVSTSSSSNIVDLTGSDFDDLKKEIVSQNPVVIYLTYDFDEPKNWNNGVPLNLHVQLLTGYNGITNEYIITDPYTRKDGKYEFVLGENKIKKLYNQMGKKAIVVR